VNALSTLVIGGCRSGKSGYALALADRVAERNKIFVATCVPQDGEMLARVEAHQKERGPDWQTIEVPLEVPQVIYDHDRTSNVILIDCLTLWVSNLLMQREDMEYVRAKGAELAAAVQKSPVPVILVSNEVGLGIVPDNRLARLFRDCAGTVNQIIAAACTRVVMTVAGIGVTIK